MPSNKEPERDGWAEANASRCRRHPEGGRGAHHASLPTLRNKYTTYCIAGTSRQNITTRLAFFAQHIPTGICEMKLQQSVVRPNVIALSAAIGLAGCGATPMWPTATAPVPVQIRVGAPVPVPDPLVRSTQTELIRLGYLNDVADGFMGPKTRNAISAFEQASGLPIDGVSSQPLLARLQATPTGGAGAAGAAAWVAPTNGTAGTSASAATPAGWVVPTSGNASAPAGNSANWVAPAK